MIPEDVQEAIDTMDKRAPDAAYQCIRDYVIAQESEIDRRFGIGGELIIARRERDALRARIDGATVITATRNGVVRTEPRLVLAHKRFALVILP